MLYVCVCVFVNNANSDIWFHCICLLNWTILDESLEWLHICIISNIIFEYSYMCISAHFWNCPFIGITNLWQISRGRIVQSMSTYNFYAYWQNCFTARSNQFILKPTVNEIVYFHILPLIWVNNDNSSGLIHIYLISSEIKQDYTFYCHLHFFLYFLQLSVHAFAHFPVEYFSILGL